MPIEESLKIIRDTSKKYHFKTKDNQLINIEHKDKHLFVNLFKWGTETSFQIELDAVLSTQHNFLETENKIEIENPDLLLRVYPIDTRSTEEFYGDSNDVIQCQDGGLRFEIVLKKKRPAMNNSFTIPIVAKNLRFSYQPFLTEKDTDGGVVRPLNVEGSYAVYHISKKNNEYNAGKAFHIYRPIAEDALGNKVWCSLHIDKYIDPTSLTITIPQQFLDEAVYPVTIDPDFGYAVIGGSWMIFCVSDDSKSPNENRIGSAWTMPAPGGTANYIRAYIRSFNGHQSNNKVFINQKDSGGANIHGQIATKENLNCAGAAHWEEFTLSSEALTEGVDYFLDIVSDESAPGLIAEETIELAFDNDGTVASATEFNVDYNNPANPWVVTPGGTQRDYSIFCNYTEAAVETNMQMNIGDVFKDISEIKINIGDVWKDVIAIKINIADVWKDVFG